MSEEKVMIEYTRYRDSLGTPTCACNFQTGEVCEFFRLQRFGTQETCLFAPDNDGGIAAPLFRRLGSQGVVGNGTLIPGEWCPLFEGVKNG